MTIRSANIPAALVSMGREVVGFIQGLIDYRKSLVQVGMRIKWRSTVEPPDGKYLSLDGSVITNADFPQLIAYAANDPDFTVGATTTTLPTDSGFWVKAT